MITEILWDDRSGTSPGREVYEYVERAVKTAMTFFDVGAGYQISVSFVTPDEIKQLNTAYRACDRVTDVLSFPLEETDPRGVAVLGDIVICCRRAEEQAVLYGHSTEREIAYLSVHSVLHLMGYDHENEDDKKEMRDAEKAIMKKLGIFKGEKTLDENVKNELIQTASDMREKAYCPYSHYHVGAAILTASGKIYGGCNIENASFGATICAERTAAVKAVSDGERDFAAVAIAVSGQSYGYPCGICRQFLCEFIDSDIPFFLIDVSGNIKTDNFYNIFPFGFKGRDME